MDRGSNMPPNAGDPCQGRRRFFSRRTFSLALHGFLRFGAATLGRRLRRSQAFHTQSNSHSMRVAPGGRCVAAKDLVDRVGPEAVLPRPFSHRLPTVEEFRTDLGKPNLPGRVS